MKYGQYYKVKVTTDHITSARPGSPVFEDDISDDLIGFIDFVSDESLHIYLFEPMVLDFECTVIHRQVPESTWQDRLHEIVEADDDLYMFWSNVFGTTDEVLGNG
jgi:hypothetical protein